MTWQKQSKSPNSILSSQNRLEKEISGLASDAEQDLLLQLRDFITATSGEGQIKRQGSTLKIAMRSVTDAMLYGSQINKVIIEISNLDSLEKDVIKSLKKGRGQSSNSAHGNKKKSLKN